MTKGWLKNPYNILHIMRIIRFRKMIHPLLKNAASTNVQHGGRIPIIENNEHFGPLILGPFDFWVTLCAQKILRSVGYARFFELDTDLKPPTPKHSLFSIIGIIFFS